MLPCRNRPDYVIEPIRSVLAQTYRDFELIIVDGSDDGTTPERIRRYLHDPRIRYFCRTPQGIPAAKNHALRQMSGRFVAHLEDDDLWDPELLDSLLGVLQRDPNTQVVYGNARHMDAHGRFILECKTPGPEGDILRKLIEKGNFIPISAALIREVPNANFI